MRKKIAGKRKENGKKWELRQPKVGKLSKKLAKMGKMKTKIVKMQSIIGEN